MPSKLNDPTREITIVNVDDHPIFNRLWGKEGFVRVNEENLEELRIEKEMIEEAGLSTGDPEVLAGKLAEAESGKGGEKE